MDLVAFSPDGHTMASGDNGSIQLWNVANPALPQLFSQPLSGSSNGGIIFASRSALTAVPWPAVKETARSSYGISPKPS